MFINTKKYSVKALLATLILINVIYIIIYLNTYELTQQTSISVSFSNESELESEEISSFIRRNAIKKPKKSRLNMVENKITLEFDIMDIFRIDISCDYILRDLGQAIPIIYRGSKPCTFASLNSDLNTKLSNSYDTSQHVEQYKPQFKVYQFNPFEQEQKIHEIAQFKDLSTGGLWTPTLNSGSECHIDQLEYIAFIVPYSASRIENLQLFLLNMHHYLQTAVNKFKYQIFVVEQESGDLFNKGMLLNRATKYVLDTYAQVDCIVIHDVDLIPANSSSILGERGDYRCRQMPWHLTNQVYLMASLSSRIYNRFLTGGILALRPDHIRVANGYSNKFFGWGAEDDDFTLRMFSNQMCIMRPGDGDKSNAPPFIMLAHQASNQNSQSIEF